LDSLFSSHARSRMQQRGIRPEALEALLDLGRVQPLRTQGRETAWPSAREGRLSVPLDLLVALSPFAAMLVLWVLED
jgi:hypothetical protein